MRAFVKGWGDGEGGSSRLLIWGGSLCGQVLHLIGMALLEEQQQLESSSEDDITFSFTLKISRESRSRVQTAPQSIYTSLHVVRADKDVFQMNAQTPDQ